MPTVKWGSYISNFFRIWNFNERKWSIIKPENSYEKPSARFGHSMDIYKNYIIVFGGSSAYNKTSKMRVWNKEIHVFDIYKQKWLTDFAKPSREVFTPRQRMYHASAVYGEWLVVHGGINTDDKSVYDDIFLFNIQQQSWIGLSESKSLIELLGARHMHTMTVVLPFNLTGKEQEALWQTTPNTPSSILSSEFWGIYLFGGYKEGFGQTNDLWLIRPILRAKPEGKSQLKKLQDTDAYSLEAIKLEPEGRPPVSRVLHSTVFFKNQYLIIYGGKSEEIYRITYLSKLHKIEEILAILFF